MASAEGTCKQILVVEDEADIRLALKEALEWKGYRVVTASNGIEALDTLSRILRPCLILLDLMMPVMNGWEFSETLRADKNFASIPIVVVSAYKDRGCEIGAQGIIMKPVDLNILFSLVKKYCGEQAQAS
jgi:CheY-like chemotaxis protein